MKDSGIATIIECSLVHAARRVYIKKKCIKHHRTNGKQPASSNSKEVIIKEQITISMGTHTGSLQQKCFFTWKYQFYKKHLKVKVYVKTQYFNMRKDLYFKQSVMTILIPIQLITLIIVNKSYH